MKNKKGLLLTVVLAVVFMQALGMGVLADMGYVYEAPQGTPAIDGEMEALWDNCQWTEIAIIYDGGDNPFNVAARAKIMWDTDNIYYFIEVTDPEVTDADCMELYLDELMCSDMGYRADDRQTIVKSDGTVTSNFAVSDEDGNDIGRENLGKAAAKATDKGYNLEVALQLSHIKGAVGTEIGMEFMLSDSDADGAWITALRWNVDTPNGDTPPWQSTEFFGKLKMVAAPAVEEPAEPEPEPAPPEEAPVAPAETPPPQAEVPEVPKTGDGGIVFFGFALAALAVLHIAKKNKIKQI